MPRTATIERTCRQCGEPFTTSRHSAEYCSVGCRQAGWRAENHQPTAPSGVRSHEALDAVLGKAGGSKELAARSGVPASYFSAYRNGDDPKLATFDRFAVHLAAMCDAGKEDVDAWRAEIKEHTRDQIVAAYAKRRPTIQLKGVKFAGTTIGQRFCEAEQPRDRAPLAGFLSLIPDQKVDVYRQATGQTRSLDRLDHVPTAGELLAIAERLDLADDARLYVRAYLPANLTLGSFTVAEIRRGEWPVDDDWAERLDVGAYRCEHCGCVVITRRSLVGRWKFCGKECREAHERGFPDPAGYHALQAWATAPEFDEALARQGLTQAEVCRRARINPSTITWLKSGASRAMTRKTSDALADALGVNRYALWSIREVSERQKAKGRRLQERGFGPKTDPATGGIDDEAMAAMRAARGERDPESRREAGQHGATARKRKSGYLETRQRHAVNFGPEGWGKLSEKAREIRELNAQLRNLDAEVKSLAADLGSPQQSKAIAAVYKTRARLLAKKEAVKAKIHRMVNDEPKRRVLEELIENPSCNIADLCDRHGFEPGTGRTWMWELRKSGIVPQVTDCVASDRASP